MFRQHPRERDPRCCAAYRPPRQNSYFESLGLLDPKASTATRKDATFRIYSMSKPITTVAAMTLFEEVRFTLSEPVGKYLPQLAKTPVAADNKPDPRPIRPNLRWCPPIVPSRFRI
jgi:hypothetical protein